MQHTNYCIGHVLLCFEAYMALVADNMLNDIIFIWFTVKNLFALATTKKLTQ